MTAAQKLLVSAHPQTPAAPPSDSASTVDVYPFSPFSSQREAWDCHELPSSSTERLSYFFCFLVALPCLVYINPRCLESHTWNPTVLHIMTDSPYDT